MHGKTPFLEVSVRHSVWLHQCLPLWLCVSGSLVLIPAPVRLSPPSPSYWRTWLFLKVSSLGASLAEEGERTLPTAATGSSFASMGTSHSQEWVTLHSLSTAWLSKAELGARLELRDSGSSGRCGWVRADVGAHPEQGPSPPSSIHVSVPLGNHPQLPRAALRPFIK